MTRNPAPAGREKELRSMGVILKAGWKIFLLFFIVFTAAFSQTVYWTETSQADFADGFIDPNLYASYRVGLEHPIYSGAVEWFPRFDLDWNGYPDFISPDYNSPFYLRVWYMGATGLDHFQYLDMGSSGGDCDFADLNVDGYAEIIHSGYWVNATTIYWNTAGVFASDDTTQIPNDNGEATYVADLDADGYLDIITAGDANTLYIYWGASGFPHGWTIGAMSSWNLTAKMVHNIECADFDNDGDLDFIVPHWDGNRNLIQFNNLGARAFDIDTIFITDVSPNWHHGLSVGDLDKDGDVDIVSTNYNVGAADPAEIILNDSTGVFGAPGSFTLGAGSCYGGSALHDFNDDGWLDILFFRSHPAGFLKICPNSAGGDPIFNDVDCYVIGPYAVDASGGTIIDANDDGDVDIFLNIGDTPAGYSLLLWGPAFTTCDSFDNSSDHHGVFREPGNIRDRSNSAWYESNIFDTGFEHGTCSGTITWIAYDERDFTGGTFPDPVGTEVIVLARSGNSPIPDASWTNWDTLTDGGILPSSLMGKKYFQYRAELWYSNPAYLPWIQQIEFTFEPCACPTIDSLWFFEETERDGENIVQICYYAEDVDGDSFLVELNIYDGGIPISVHTIYDSVAGYTPPNIGWVHSGEHCFYWDMAADYPGYEGCDFDVEILIHNESTEILSVVDSFPIINVQGVAWDGTYLWVGRCHGGNRVSTPDSNWIYQVNPITHEILDSMMFFHSGASFPPANDTLDGTLGDMCWHNDTLWAVGEQGANVRAHLFAIDTSAKTIERVTTTTLFGGTRWGQGLCWWNGSFWTNESVGNIYRADDYPPYNSSLWLAVDDTFRAYHGGDSLFYADISADGMCFALNHFWIVRNAPSIPSYILFQIDTMGFVVDSFALTAAGTYGPEGLTFDGGSFWYGDHTGDMVYRVSLWGCDDTMLVNGCLDSDMPDVDIIDSSICGDTMFIGDIDTAIYTVLDSFFVYGTDCSVWVICGSDTAFVGEFFDTVFEWTVPDLPCDSARLAVATYDSFGNRGIDTTCFFTIVPCGPAIASVLCPTAVSFASCSSAYAVFHVEDLYSADIDTLGAFFTRITVYPSGDADTAYFSSPAAQINWLGADDIYDINFIDSYADGDSVTITLDSLFNVWGCKIIP